MRLGGEKTEMNEFILDLDEIISHPITVWFEGDGNLWNLSWDRGEMEAERGDEAFDLDLCAIEVYWESVNCKFVRRFEIEFVTLFSLIENCF